MFSIRQALRFAVRAACSRHCVHHRSTPFTCKPIAPIVLRNDRLLHEASDSGGSKKLGQLDRKMRLIFTCKKCKTRNSKLISKLAYDKGVILIRCDGCKNNHLIADHLGWFADKHKGKGTNIEKIMASKGETVQKILNDRDGYYEAVSKKELHQLNVSETKESDAKNCLEKTNEPEPANKS